MSIERYKPANSEEGMIFDQKFCCVCKHDQDYQRGIGDSCEIVANAMVFEIENKQYPKEWIYKDGKPVCTVFESVDDD